MKKRLIASRVPSDPADVCVHGTYDVGLAAARLLWMATMWPWDWYSCCLPVAIMVINQKFFISGFKGLSTSGPEHGHAGGAGLWRILCLQRICAVCNDRTHR